MHIELYLKDNSKESVVMYIDLDEFCGKYDGGNLYLLNARHSLFIHSYLTKITLLNNRNFSAISADEKKSCKFIIATSAGEAREVAIVIHRWHSISLDLFLKLGTHLM